MTNINTLVDRLDKAQERLSVGVGDREELEKQERVFQTTLPELYRAASDDVGPYIHYLKWWSAYMDKRLSYWWLR